MLAEKTCGECGEHGHSAKSCGGPFFVAFKVEIPKAMLAEIDALSNSEGVTRSAITRRLLIEALTYREITGVKPFRS